MKILELNGLKYSKSNFGDYKLRCILELDTIDSEFNHRMNIYTTDTDKENIGKVLFERVNKEKVNSVKIIHWATKEQDDISSKFIDDWLKEGL